MTGTLTVAQHPSEARYWEGGNYELNMSFETLRDRLWLEIMQALWTDPLLYGPLGARYTPDHRAVSRVEVQIPPPTASLVQHGQIQVGDIVVGCDVQATRSLFECVSILVPVGMFAGLSAGPDIRQAHPELAALDDVFYAIALRLYDVVPFSIAVIGYERACQLPLELRSDGEQRHNFLINGNFLIREEVLQTIEPDLAPYETVRPALRWMPPKV